MNIGKLSVMKDKANEGMATDFQNTKRYLKHCVANTCTTHITLSDVDTDLEKKIEAQSKGVDSLKKTLKKHNGGKVGGINAVDGFPTAIKKQVL